MRRSDPLPDAPDRVLLIKPSALGDVVTALPVLRGLRRTFPKAHLSWLVSRSCAPLIEADPELDEVVYFDRRRLGSAWRSPRAAAELARFLRGLRRGRYDWVIDLQGLLRSGLFARATGAAVRAGFADAREGAWLCYTHRCRAVEPHTVDRNVAMARLLGVEARRRDMRLFVPPEGRQYAESFRAGLPSGTGGRYVVLVPPTRWPTKLYPVRRWQAVATELGRRVPLAVAGTHADQADCLRIAQAAGPSAVSLAGQTTIPQLVGLIAGAACVLCCDSAALFIAQAVGTEVVALIGPTRVRKTGPLPGLPLRGSGEPGGRAIVADVPCQGCLRRRCRHITCMETIPPAAVLAAVDDALRGQAVV